MLNGQKVWTSGARHAALGELIARTDPAQARHRGLTAFLVPMDAPGVEIRPIRQMSGGSSFNEVFFTDVVVPDEARLGDIGQGWQVALTTLGFERARSGAGAQQPGGSFAQVAATARALGVQHDPLVRQLLADLYVRSEVQRRYAEKMTARPPRPADGGAGGAHARRGGVGPEADVVGEPDADLRRGERAAGSAAGRGHRGAGHALPGPSTCWARRDTGSPAEPRKSSGTSSPNGCSACPASPGHRPERPGRALPHPSPGASHQ